MRRLTILGLAVLCIALAGCFAPPIVDPDDPVDPPRAVPVADFFYSNPPPIQTGSKVRFDGSASYDPNDEIMWGQWDFGDGDDPSGGIWATTEKVWKNGEWTWSTVATNVQTPWHKYAEPGGYTVRLTVWDYEGNKGSTTRKVRVAR